MGKACRGQLVWIFAVWTAALTLGTSIIYLYFEESGMGILEMLLYGFAYYAAPIALLCLQGQSGWGSLRWGLLSQMAALIALAFLGGIWGALALALIGSAVFPLFWVPFNALWFTYKKGKNAIESAIYVGMGSFAGIFCPAIAGIIVVFWGFPALFLLSALLLVPGLVLLRGDCAPNEAAAINNSESLGEIAGLRTLIFMEGFGGMGTFILIPMITLGYFDEPLGFGMFFSAAGLLSIALSMVFAKMSDELGNRRGFLLFSSAGFGAGMALCSASYEPAAWFASVVVAMFFRNLFFPFSNAILVDRCGKLHPAMHGRELLLNAGRAMGALLAIGAYLLWGDLRLPLLIAGISLFAYGAVFEFFKKKKLGVGIVEAAIA
ncbi:hypothetical protein JW721_01005 [Candidatus Micrarchaeota archaeon]|nr:hypothetical protein [Candidatus Micrarchaeota archaeon]